MLQVSKLTALFRYLPPPSHKHTYTPSMKLTLVWWGVGAFKLRGFNKVRQQGELIWAVTTVATIWLNGSSLLLCQELIQCWLEKIRKASCKNDPSWCSVGSTIFSFCWVKTAAEISEEEGIYASRFLPLVILKIYRSCILFLVTRFKWYSFAQLPTWGSFYVFDVEAKVLDTENFPPDTITDLNTGITLILFGQEKPLQWKEINKNNQTSMKIKSRKVSC